MKPRIRYALGILAAGFISLVTVEAIWAQSNSQARAVRLSFVEGEVTVERPDVQGWAEAPVNTPLQQGFQLSTGENSFAEIQFENGGTIRLGESALLDLTQLELDANGGTINHVEIRQGYATFHLLPSRLGESLQVGTSYGTLIAQGGTQFRVDLDQGVERVEVFDGQVEVQSNQGDMTIEKDSVLVTQPGTSGTVVTQGITADDWDRWVDDREARMEAAATGPAPNTYTEEEGEAPYGWNDLLQYGTWSNVPGAGYGWSPTSVAIGWSPYSNGQWCWYPGWGYTWIGAEPWGWLPYHYGGWEFLPGRGWVWFPGSFKTWSPSHVAWFHGPGWLGWIPRGHGKERDIACGNNCGGGVVSASTFRRGGLLNSNLMLSVSPATGERVREPGIIPTSAAKLTGPAISLPAAQRQGFRGNPPHSPATAGMATAATSSAQSRRVEATPPNSTLVYEPEENRYINSRRVMTPQRPPASFAGASGSTTQTANPGSIQPAPGESPEQETRPVENRGIGQPAPAMGVIQARPIHSWSQMGSAPRANPNTYASPANPGNPLAGRGPSVPNSSRTEGRESGGGGAGNHNGGGTAGGEHFSWAPAGGGSTGGGATGGGTPAGGHSGSAPSGGGHAGGAPAGGRASGGGHH